jgi:hypothetical protein
VNLVVCQWPQCQLHYVCDCMYASLAQPPLLPHFQRWHKCNACWPSQLSPLADISTLLKARFGIVLPPTQRCHNPHVVRQWCIGSPYCLPNPRPMVLGSHSRLFPPTAHSQNAARLTSATKFLCCSAQLYPPTHLSFILISDGFCGVVRPAAPTSLLRRPGTPSPAGPTGRRAAAAAVGLPESACCSSPPPGLLWGRSTLENALKWLCRHQ